ncbi:MAG: hypothetical protein L3J45_02070 [Flavobacteriaceae bacterium]|nr:hypothetical protein [Flavobacteriaceae bacterium]
MNNYYEDYMSGVKAYQECSYENSIYFFEKALSVLKFAGLDKETENDTYETGYYNLGNAKKEVSDYAGAIECYKKTIDSNPSRADLEKIYDSLRECCFINYTDMSLKTAVKYLNICTKYFPKNQEAFINKGIAYANLKDDYNSRIAFETAKKLGNKDAQGFINKYFK